MNSSSDEKTKRGKKHTKKAKKHHKKRKNSERRDSDSGSSSDHKSKKRKREKKNKKRKSSQHSPDSPILRNKSPVPTQDVSLDADIVTTQNFGIAGESSEVGPCLSDYVADKSVKPKGPMTKEQWDKQQSVIRRVHDPVTGRTRVIRGNGEILEEIVSRDRHVAINKAATREDGAYFETVLGLKRHKQ